jgi:hypothetical protein
VRGNRSFSDLAAFRADDLNLIGLGQPERVPAEMVSASFFRLLAVQPILGRTFLATDDQLGATPVALISENFWQRKFGSSPAAIGQTLTLSGTSYVIIGVIPATFQYDARNFHRSDVYVPIGAWNAPGWFRNRTVSMGMDVVGRLKPGVSLERADGDMQALARGLADQRSSLGGASLVSRLERGSGPCPRRVAADGTEVGDTSGHPGRFPQSQFRADDQRLQHSALLAGRPSTAIETSGDEMGAVLYRRGQLSEGHGNPAATRALPDNARR